MVRAQLVPEVVYAADVATGLIPEEGLAKGSLACSEGYTTFMDGFATFLTYLSGLALPVEAIAKVRDDYFAAFEKLNSHPDEMCLARVENKSHCGAKLTGPRASKESRRCLRHANTDLLGVVLNMTDSRPAALSPCPACSGSVKGGSDVLMCAVCDQQFHP